MNSCQLTECSPGTSVLVQILTHHVIHAGSFLLEVKIHGCFLATLIVLGLPRGLVPVTTYIISWSIEGGSLLMMCPNHLNLPSLMTSSIGLMWSSSYVCISDLISSRGTV